MELKRPVTYIDATNLTRAERRPYLKLAKLYNCRIEAVFFDVPVEECQRRNRQRAASAFGGRLVPEDVIERMAARLQPPSVEEGFARVMVVR